MLQQSKHKRFLAGIVTFLFVSMVPLSIFCETIDITINKKTQKPIEHTWTKTIADVCAAINTEFNTITASTSQQQVSQIFEDALKKIDAIKQEGKKHGVVIESVTLTMGGAPCVTMKWKFAEPTQTPESRIGQ
jgi:hypothetical protein